MAAPLPFSESELRLLRVLLKRMVRFMVVGLSAATLQGAPVVTQDVGLWFENLGALKTSRALQEVGAAYVPPSNSNPPMLAGAGAELFDIVMAGRCRTERMKICVFLCRGCWPGCRWP